MIELPLPTESSNAPPLGWFRGGCSDGSCSGSGAVEPWEPDPDGLGFCGCAGRSAEPRSLEFGAEGTAWSGELPPPGAFGEVRSSPCAGNSGSACSRPPSGAAVGTAEASGIIGFRVSCGRAVKFLGSGVEVGPSRWNTADTAGASTHPARQHAVTLVSAAASSVRRISIDRFYLLHPASARASCGTSWCGWQPAGQTRWR